MQQRVLELIPRIANEQLTEELLIVNDNLNNVFLRHERYPSLSLAAAHPPTPSPSAPWSPRAADLSSPQTPGRPPRASVLSCLLPAWACTPPFLYLSSPRQLALHRRCPCVQPPETAAVGLSMWARSQAGWSVLAHATTAWLWGLGPLAELN